MRIDGSSFWTGFLVGAGIGFLAGILLMVLKVGAA